MIPGFYHKTIYGYTVLEYGVEQEGVLYYVLLRRIDTGERFRMRRYDLDKIILPEQAESPALAQQKQFGIQLGIL